MRSLMLSAGAFFAIAAASPDTTDEESRTTRSASTAVEIGVGDVSLGLVVPQLKLCITCWPGWG